MPKSLSDVRRVTRSVLVRSAKAVFAGLTVYGEYHLGSL